MSVKTLILARAVRCVQKLYHTVASFVSATISSKAWASRFCAFFVNTTLVLGLLSGCTLLPTHEADQPIPEQGSLSLPTKPNKSMPTGRNGFKGSSPAVTSPAIRSVILLIGDGMGFEHLKAASLYAHGAEGQLFMQTAPYQNVVSTGNVEDEVTDSAAAATAMATGQRVENRVLSLSADGQPLESSLEFFQNRCKSTGMVVTAYLNHATPAAFAAHQPDRALLSEIAADIYTETKPNVLLGGTAEGITTALAEKAGYTVVKNRADLLETSNDVAYLSGQFSNGNMGYEYEYATGLKPFYDEQPHLSEMTAKALDILNTDPDGFFLMVEGSRIDHAAHANALPHMLFEVLEFDKTVQTVVEWAAGRPDVLVIVTADHETGGLHDVQASGAAQFPTSSWTTGQHTSHHVPIYGWNVAHNEADGKINSTFVYRLTTDGFAPPPTECAVERARSEGVSSSSTPNGAEADPASSGNQIHLPLIHVAND